MDEKIFPYKILGELGRGGMGVVYKAQDLTLDRTVAIKFLLSGMDTPANTSRFLREAKAIAKLQHAHIVSLYHIDYHEGKPYFAMEFIEGVSLQQIIANSTLSTKKMVAIIHKIAKAIDYAHEQGIIHRDLKPSNIMIDSENKPKVMDFGLAKIADASKALSQTGEVFGTFYYMSPEQAEGRVRDIDRRSDVYSLGAILYHVLTGFPPFAGSSAGQIIHHIIYSQPKPPQEIKPHIAKSLQTICLKALEKNPRHRYQTAALFAADLARFQRGKKVASPSLNRYFFAKLRQYKTFVAVVIAIIATVAVMTALSHQDITKQQIEQPIIAQKERQEVASEEQNAQQPPLQERESSPQEQPKPLIQTGDWWKTADFSGVWDCYGNFEGLVVEAEQQQGILTIKKLAGKNYVPKGALVAKGALQDNPCPLTVILRSSLGQAKSFKAKGHLLNENFVVVVFALYTIETQLILKRQGKFPAVQVAKLDLSGMWQQRLGSKIVAEIAIKQVGNAVTGENIADKSEFLQGDLLQNPFHGRVKEQTLKGIERWGDAKFHIVRDDLMIVDYSGLLGHSSATFLTKER